MKKFVTKKSLLIFIFFIATILRFYSISNIPPSLNWDEAALGYNAYSLGIDGKDEFGKTLPITYLESFGDYKPVVYSYLSVVPVKIFGLNEFGVRFASAFLGSVTVLLVFFLVKEIFVKKEDKKKTDLIALITAGILAISPWHLMLSRGAYEANVSTFFIIFGVFFFLKAINKNLWFLIPSAISFVVTFYTFNTARVFIPLFVIALAIGFRKVLLKNITQVFVSGLIGLFLLLPLIPFLFSPQAQLRYEEVNIFSNPKIVESANNYIENDGNAFWSKILHNRRVLYGLEFTKHYFDNLNPSFLFIKGDGNPRFATQDVGQLYLLELPFLIIGLLILIRKREGHYWIIPVWILLGLIPAATARETPHALRIETIIPTLQILVAYGIVEIYMNLKRFRKLFSVLVIAIFIISTLYFYHGLMNHYSREYSSEWQYPYKEAVSYVLENEGKYDEIVITEELGRPYIYFLLYGKYSPQQFRESFDVEREVYGFVHVNGFSKFKFVKDISDEMLESKKLYIDTKGEVSDKNKILKSFNLLNGKPGLVAYEKNN